MNLNLTFMFVSVKEAAELTGKSATTIYRLCNKRINTDYVRKEDNKFLIDKEFLMATYPVEEPEELPVLEDGKPEMRFENVIENNSSVETEEKPIVLEKSEAILSNEKDITSHEELDAGSTVEFEERQEKSYFQQLSSKEVIIGLVTSLGIIILFIYLLSQISH